MSSTCCSELIFNYNIEHPPPFPSKFLIYRLLKAKPFLLNFMVYHQTWEKMVGDKGFLAKFSAPFGLENLDKALYWKTQ